MPGSILRAAQHRGVVGVPARAAPAVLGRYLSIYLYISLSIYIYIYTQT